MEHDLRVDTELKLEVHTGNILGVDLGTEQELGPGITIKLAPKMNGPIFETIARDPKIGEVSFRIPEGEDSATENWEPSVKPPIKDLELWLDQQADQLGTPTWWEELKAVPGITSANLPCCTLPAEIQFWASPDQSYSAPPAPKSLN